MKIFSLTILFFFSYVIFENTLLKHLVAITYFLQFFGFLGLAGLVIYEFFSVFKEVKTKIDNKNDGFSTISGDGLPKLKPINCQSCGAGMPLSEGEMICPSCGTKTKTPENYFNVAHAREEINAKIRDAAVYLKRANLLASNWMRIAIGLLLIWLVFSFVMFVFFNFNGNLEPYGTWLKANSVVKTVSKFGYFTYLFWIFSLLLGFLIWSPRLRKVLPKVDFAENAVANETANCSQCGGTISYKHNDLATICGYCGVETFRVKFAWKLKKLTNTANEKASFSLIEARKYAEDAIEEIIGTPKVLMFLLMLVAIIFGGIGMFSAIFG